MENSLSTQNQGLAPTSVHNSEEPQIRKRPEVNIFIQIRLKPEQVEPFENDLEFLCNEYLNMGKEDGEDD